jgi:tRNA threonylcarbamoyladenosine biosynthesis protein TsaB
MILALETSTRRASLAVYDEAAQEVLWEEAFETDRSHNSIIFEPVETALQQFEDRITKIAVGLGPGVYGGIRVGIAVANGLGLARDWETVGVSSLEAFSEEEDYLVVGDARRKTFFFAEVIAGTLSGEPKLLSAEDLETRLADYEGSVVSAEESVVERFSRVQLAFPEATRIARRATQEGAFPEKEKALEPHYLRAPYITTPKTASSH